MSRSLFKRRTKTIIYDDEKKIRNDKILMIVGLILAVAVLGTCVYLVISYLNKPKTNDGFDAKYVDPRFELLTLKTITEFEKPTYNYYNYLNNKTFLGYFYKNDKLERATLTDSIKILTTLNRMFDCVNKSNQPSCGIKITYDGYKTSDKEVLKYAKLIYGNDITINQQSINIPYGSIENIKFEDNTYTFSQIADNVRKSLMTYIDQEISVKVENNQAIVIKTFGYVEEQRLNNKLSGYIVYSSDDKTEIIFSVKRNFETTEDIRLDVKEKLLNNNAPKVKIIFDRQDDGTFIFKQIDKYIEEN